MASASSWSCGPELQVERRERFIEQNDFRLVDDGARDGNTLALPARHLIDFTRFVSDQVDELERLLDFRLDVGLFHLLDA